VEEIRAGGHVVFVTPQGRLYNQEVARELAAKEHVVLVCGRYEGIDARVERRIDDEISLGDYILTGGELAALVIIDSTARLLPGVLGCADSAARDTFSRGLLKYPQYTRPQDFDGEGVPEVLLSGDHRAIAEWRFVESVRRTKRRRPDLLGRAVFTERELALLAAAGVDVRG
ncbi:MAG: tRNA (guanosine(37)-N1)-methyltransferase TrmD, partial [Desulfobacteraceae bacterium]|nr:tRNA (guanosine(37)-N1)-methyltransferase TrmD [Desulfobacteraceae bacterium]